MFGYPSLGNHTALHTQGQMPLTACQLDENCEPQPQWTSQAGGFEEAYLVEFNVEVWCRAQVQLPILFPEASYRKQKGQMWARADLSHAP